MKVLHDMTEDKGYRQSIDFANKFRITKQAVSFAARHNHYKCCGRYLELVEIDEKDLENYNFE